MQDMGLVRNVAKIKGLSEEEIRSQSKTSRRAHTVAATKESFFRCLGKMIGKPTHRIFG